MHKRQVTSIMPVFPRDTVKVPQSMLDLTQWVTWKYAMNDGTEAKVPWDAPRGQRASSTNAATWYTYEQCCAHLEEDRRLGIGFMFKPPDIGIDLDKCIKDGVMDVRAREVLAKFPQTYAEISPSGTGVHLVVQGTYPPDLGHKWGRKETGTLEMYTRGRYFTVTGDVIAGAPSQIQCVSEEELRWVVSKFILKASKGVHTCEAGEDTAPLRKGSTLYAALCAGNLNWETTWDGTRKLEGAQGDQTDSAYDMSLARMACGEDVPDQDILRLLEGRRRDLGLPPKHRGALIRTIEKAHQECAETEQDKVLDNPESLVRDAKLAIIKRELGLSVSRFVQMGSDDAHFRVVLAEGHPRDMGTYAVCKTCAPWENLAAERAQPGAKRLTIAKKRWVKIFDILFTLREVEESAETGPRAETLAWLKAHIGSIACHPATYDTLHFKSPFVDETGSYVVFDELYTDVCRTNYKVTRGALASRLSVLGWARVTLTRSDETHGAVTEDYWHKGRERIETVETVETVETEDVHGA